MGWWSVRWEAQLLGAVDFVVKATFFFSTPARAWDAERQQTDIRYFKHRYKYEILIQNLHFTYTIHLQRIRFH